MSGGDLSSPTLSAPNLATVLVVTKPQQGQGIFSIRGNVGSQSIRLPLSPNPRKAHLQFGGSPRPKFQGAIKIHGPMFDQAPGTMNPSASGGDLKQSRNETVPKYASMGQQLHIPSPNKLPKNQMFETEADMMSEASLYRANVSRGDKMSPNQLSRFVSMKQPIDIKLEPPDQFYQGGELSQHQRVSPTVHIHLPSSNYRHITPMNNLQDSVKGNLVESVRDGIRSAGVRSDAISLLVSDHDADNSSRIHSSSASPNANNIAMKYELVPQQGLKRHLQGQQMQPHLPNSLQNHLKNHLKVATTNTGDSQSALSPLHSPPPLRPAPSNQHRSIALRSPPNLTPSTVISHFDFNPVITTTSVISQTGRIIHHPGAPISSKCYIEDDHNAGNGQLRPHESGTATCVGNSINENTAAAQMPTQLKTSTINFTYIPIKDKATDKIVYVPVNQDAEKDRQHPVFIYSKQHKQRHRFHEQMPGGAPQVGSQGDLKPQPLDDRERHQPYSGVTRKFTVRTLHRDSNAGSLPSGVTTVRIQGPNFKEVKSNSENQQEESHYSFNDGLLERMSRNSSNELLPPTSAVQMQRMAVSDLLSQRNHKSSNASERFSSGGAHFVKNDVSYEEISDDEDNDEMDYEYMDDNAENEMVDGDSSNFDRRNSHGFRGRKRGKKHFLTRRKSTSNHPYKVKYKQALEQAKFMREQRPSFFASQMQARSSEDVFALPRESAIAFDDERRSLGNSGKADEHSELKDERLKGDVFGSNERIDSFNKGPINADDSALEESVVSKGLLVTKELASNDSSSSAGVEKGNGELKRRRVEAPNKFGNGFVFGQWAVGEDIKVKKKKVAPGKCCFEVTHNSIRRTDCAAFFHSIFDSFNRQISPTCFVIVW